MRTLVLALAILASTSGCAVNKLAERLGAMNGQRIETVFDRIGYPDRKEVFGTDTVYYWGTDQPDGPSCTFKVVASADGTVKSSSVYGNEYGCSTWAGQLKPKS